MDPSFKVYEEKHIVFDNDGNVIPLRPLSSPSSHPSGYDPVNIDSGQPPEESNISVLSRYSSDRSLVHTTYAPSITDTKVYGQSAPADAKSIMNISSTPSDAFYHPHHSIYTMHSVLMADGILNQVDPTDFEDMPARYDKSSVKAKITWFGELCLAGIGMFVEALVIITTGQIKTIWHGMYPECWTPTEDQHCPDLISCCGLFPNTPADSNGICAVPLPNDSCQDDGSFSSSLLCNSRVTTGVSYSEFAGIMAGMLTFGAACDLIGRKNAGTLTSLLMIVGIAGMTLFDDANVSTLFITFSVFFGVFGMGVGGEYPLTASGAAAYHVGNTEAALLDDEDQHHRRVLLEATRTVRRGETISLVFAMQGIGAVLGSIILLCLIYFSNQTRIQCDNPSSNSSGNNPDALSGIWRSFYLIGLLTVVLLLLYRSLILEEDSDRSKVRERQLRREARLGKDANSKWKILKFYAPRLIGTGGNWFLWDIAFYGLKLYSGPIFNSINPEGEQ
jgi:MFS family permease